MNAQNKVEKTDKINLGLWIAISSVSGIGGVAILLALSGFTIFPVLAALFLVIFIIASSRYEIKE